MDVAPDRAGFGSQSLLHSFAGRSRRKRLTPSWPDSPAGRVGVRALCRAWSGRGGWPQGLAWPTWSIRRLCYSSQKANFSIASLPAPRMRAHRAELVQKPTGLSASSHSLPASVPAMLGPVSLQEPTLLLGLSPNCSPSLVRTPFPLSQVKSQLTFPTAYECHFLQEAFPGLPSRPDSP